MRFGKPNYYFFICLSLVLFLIITSLPLPRKTTFQKVAQEDKRTRMDLAMEQEIARTKDPALGYVPKQRLLSAYAYANSRRANATSRAIRGVEWMERGPTNVGGRTRAIMVDPNDPSQQTIWAAGVAGGLWKSTAISDEQPNWIAVNDFFDNIAITSLAFDPTNTSVMYFGTGEGFFNGDAVEGNGIWKSTNGGNSWTSLSSTITDDRTSCSGVGDCNFQFVQKIVVTGNGTILAATRSIYSNRGGVMRSTDGGSSWTKVLTGLEDPNSCSGPGGTYLDWPSDIEIAANADIYVGFGIARNNGIWKSTDDGATWGSGPVYTSACDEERIELATAPSNSDIVYALIQEDNSTIKKIMRTTNGGTSWSDLTIPSWKDQNCTFASSDFTRNQAWYDLIAAVDPNDANTIFIGGIDLLRSTNGGNSWTQLTNWAGLCDYPEVHADQHSIVFAPGSSDVIYFGNDGGVYQTTTGSDTQPVFKRKEDNYNTTQFYSVAMHPGSGSSYFLAGAQDNGTNKFTEPGLGQVVEAVGGDGAFAHIDQDDPSFQIAAYTRSNFRKSTDGGNTFSALYSSNTGLFINPTDYADSDDEFYASYGAGKYLRSDRIKSNARFSSVSIAQFGSAQVTSITTSPNTSQRVFFGLNDGSVFQIDNAGNSGTKTVTDLSGSSFPGGSVSCIAVEDGDDNHLVVAYSNYGVNSVWETKNGGSSWSSIEGNLPDMPIRWVLFNPNDADEAIVATELGIWSTDNLNDSNTDWEPSNSGLANVRTDMLQVRSSDNLVVAATHGRGLFTSDIFASPKADFVADHEVVYAESVVQFNDISYKSSSWEWSFGDGGFSALQNPVHTYNVPGVYSVSLTINGSETETKTGLIKVLPNVGTPFLAADGGDFEINQAYFASESLTGGVDLWELGVPSNAIKTLSSETNGWKTDLDSDILQADYSCALYSPNFNFTATGSYSLSFQKSMETRYPNAPFAVQVQYSIDNGQNWLRLGTDNDTDGTNWYDRGPSSSDAVETNVIHDRIGFIGNYTDEFTDYDVSFLAGNDAVAFRFVLFVKSGYSTNGYENDGFMIDDFQLSGPDNEPINNITDPLSGTAVQFDGSSGYIQLSEVIIPETFSVNLWVNPQTVNDNQSFLAKHDSGGNDIFRFGFYNGGYEVNIRGESLTAGAKAIGVQQLTVVVEKLSGSSSNVIIYRNGVEIGQQEINEVIADASGLPWVLGQEWDGLSTSDFLNGIIDEVAFWGFALDTTQVRERLHLIRTGQEIGLLAYWQLNEGVGTTTVDQLTANSGALIGATSWVNSDFPVGTGDALLLSPAVDGDFSFSETDMSINFTGITGSGFDLVVTRIDADPGGIQPEELATRNEIIKNPYWIIEKYGVESFSSANLTYNLGVGAIIETDPAEVVLLKRGSNSVDGWTEDVSAFSVDNGTGTVIFNGVTGFSQIAIGATSLAVPIELLDFKVKWQPLMQSVNLEWVTATETNNDHFELERSFNAELWSTISTIKGQGNTTDLNLYEYQDRDLTFAGNTYYRLRQVDFDGSYSYGPVRMVVIPEMTLPSISVYPNPLTANSRLKIYSPNTGALALQLYALNGQLVSSNQANVQKGLNYISLNDYQHIQTGEYILVLKAENYQRAVRIVR